MVVEAISLGIGVTGFACAGWFYWHLWRWARECQEARIAIAYKKKVKIDAPLTEWLLWIREANKDKASGGRMVYNVGGTSVAIIKRIKVPRKHRSQPKPANRPSQVSQLSRSPAKEAK